MISIYNNIVCKPIPYAGGLKSEVKSGVAFVKQKVDIVSLEVLFDAQVVESGLKYTIPAGSLVYVKEERMATMPWGKNVLKINGTEVQVIPANEVISYEEKN